jgi:hypothetical protein
MLEFYQLTVLRTKEEKTEMCRFRFRLQRLANNKDMVAREGLEPPPPAFSGLDSLSLNPFSINNLICRGGHSFVTIL